MFKFLVFGLLLAAAFGLAAEAPRKPVCTEAIAGRLWPDEANDNPKFAAALEPYGFPEVCMRIESVYVWRARTVRLGQLRKDTASKHTPENGKPATDERAKSAGQ